ncbi:ABC transporter substrate-binding protein [Nocardioides yefusunii]|uniref:ABC transporter substrate-binding protein n=1 Tax=Nocardioides yefusunii TaxID=2500546 RepID=A0ABW1QUK5_9ACTN|nr:ABC transporter substrate-binding protein [Nocardioides yefusunii]
MRRHRLGTGLTATALVTLTALTGCSSSGDSSSSAKNDGTELRLAIGGEDEAGYDPTLGWGRYGSPLFQSTLLTRNADLSFGNDLATSYEVSKDGLTWTVALRDDVTFSDGEALTAADVAYTFTAASKSGGLTDVTNLASAKAVDDTTVEFTLKKPQSTFVNRLASLGIVPEHAHGSDYAKNPIGSGPFTFVDWQQGQQLVVQRNENYYGDKPDFERVTFVFTEEDASLAAVRSGEVNVAGLPASLVGQKIDGTHVVPVTSIDNRGISFPTVPAAGKKSPAGEPIGNDITADVAVRRAVNLSVDRQALVDGIVDGYGTAAFGPVDNSPWFEEKTRFTDNDVAAAKKELADGGWKDTDGDGVVEKDGRKAEFTLVYPAGDSLRQGIALSVVDQVKRAGITVKTEGLGWEQIYARQHSDAVLFGWGSHDPYEMYTLYKSDLAGVESNNPGYYRNADVDAELDAALLATDQTEATSHWKAAQLPFSGTKDAAWAWLVNLEHTYVVDDCLDLGEPRTEPHGHGWPLTAGIADWKWTC